MLWTTTPKLIRMLRKVLPPYRGPSLTLYRGHGAFNHQHRTYGLSWSADSAVAAGFARGKWRTWEGGSVVVQSAVPARAIIAQVPDDYEEQEFLVDHRDLGAVSVLQTLSQISPEEHSEC